MESKKKKCSFSEHKELDAISYCQKCKIYMCNKCNTHHIRLFENHYQYNIEKDIKDIFTGFCNEKKHFNELEFFCKTHNQLCCIACISKIKNNDYGQHTDCDICNIEKIKDEKINNLKGNIKNLEGYSKILGQKIEELKKLFEKINENKEIIKTEIQKSFTY